MHASKLSDSILARTFGYVLSNRGGLYSKFHSFKRWKVERSLLSVCRAWRNVALPIVHEKSFILAVSTGVQKNDIDMDANYHSNSIKGGKCHYYSDANDCNLCYDGYDSEYGQDTYSVPSREQMRLKVEDFAVTSSMDIISADMDNPHPRHIDIIIDIRHNPVTGIKKVFKKARTYSKFLAKVETMELFIHSEYIEGKLFDQPSDIAEAQSIGTELAQIIPSVKSIKWRKSNGYEPTLHEFVKHMVKCYAHQLNEFVLPQTALDSAENMSDKLEYVHMYSNVSISKSVPHIPAGNIKHLNMGYKVWNFDWSTFISNDSSSDSNSPKTLVFENLKYLQLRIERGIFTFYDKAQTLAYNKHVYDYKMVAPNLDHIAVHICPATLLILASIEKPSVIKDIRFKIQASVFCFKNFNLAKARKMLAEYGDEENFKACQNYSGSFITGLLNIHGLAEYSKAVIGYSYSSPSAMEISWKYLDEVKFEELLDDKQLELLVARHPNLKIA